MNRTPMAATCAATALACATLTAQAADLPPVADFFKNPALTSNSVQLSPSGKYLAATRDNEKTHHRMLVVIDLGEKREAKAVAAYNDADVIDVHWVNDDRLVFRLRDLSAAYFNRIQYGSGLFSVPRAGDEAPKALIRRDWDTGTVNAPVEIARVRPRDFSLDPTHFFHSTLHDGSANVLVVKNNYAHVAGGNVMTEILGSTLLKVNAETGRSEIVGNGAPARASDWVADGVGNARIVYTESKGTTQIHWKATPQADWAMLREMPQYGVVTGKGAILSVLGISDEDKLYMVTGDDNAAGTTMLASLNLRQANAQPVPVIATPGYDFTGELVMGPKNRVVGVHYLTDAKGTHWFDPKLKAIQEQVDKALPNTNNIIDCGACDNPERVLVTAYSDRQPAVYLLFHVAANKFESVASTRPWIKTEQMSERGFERIKARDGMEIPVHVTRPLGQKGPAPTVVLVHGGPFVRGAEWDWYPETQFLASRGYAVIEPEFRGSNGFGSKLRFAGFKQWGLSMQDDIADATTWAIQKGVADPKRICIAGGSYGGYATLMGMIRYPELYRCGVDTFGVTDLNLMYTASWSDASDDFRAYGMPTLIGDREKDAAQLEATSPLKQHAKLNAPLLMAHGRRDQRVPFEHFSKMVDALKTHNPNVETAIYNEEGHGWSLDANEIDFWTRAEKFLDKNLKNAP